MLLRLAEIAGEKLQAYAAEIAETSGYAWVRPILETRVTYNATEDLHQVHLEPAPLTDEEQVEADKLLETISALEAESEVLDEDDEAATAEFQTRWDAASSAYDALHDKPPVIPEEMKANVGCFVIIGADGHNVRSVAKAVWAIASANSSRSFPIKPHTASIRS